MEAVPTEVKGAQRSGHKDVTLHEVRQAKDTLLDYRTMMTFINGLDDPSMDQFARSHHFKKVGGLDFAVKEIAKDVAKAYRVLTQAESQDGVVKDSALDCWRQRRIPPVNQRLLHPFRIEDSEEGIKIAVIIWIRDGKERFTDFDRFQEGSTTLAKREYMYPIKQAA